MNKISNYKRIIFCKNNRCNICWIIQWINFKKNQKNNKKNNNKKNNKKNNILIYNNKVP